MMIHIKSFFRKKYIRIFIIILILLTIFFCFLDYQNKLLDHINFYDDVYLIVDREKYERIVGDDIEYLKIINKDDYSNYFNLMTIERVKEYNYLYMIKFNKYSLYEKYKEYAVIFSSNSIYDSNIKEWKFSKVIIDVLYIIVILLFIISLIVITVYEINDFKLLYILCYHKHQIFLIFMINLFLLLLTDIVIIVFYKSLF